MIQQENWSWTILFSETKAIAELIRSNPKYKYLGFSIDVNEYDVIDFDKYMAAISGNKIPGTWYFLVKISGPNGIEKILLSFDRFERENYKLGYDISMVPLRYDGQEFVKLSSEPISLRNVYYSNGSLIFLNNDGSEVIGKVRHEMSLMIAEVIKAYL